MFFPQWWPNTNQKIACRGVWVPKCRKDHIFRACEGVKLWVSSSDSRSKAWILQVFECSWWSKSWIDEKTCISRSFADLDFSLCENHCHRIWTASPITPRLSMLGQEETIAATCAWGGKTGFRRTLGEVVHIGGSTMAGPAAGWHICGWTIDIDIGWESHQQWQA